MADSSGSTQPTRRADRRGGYQAGRARHGLTERGACRLDRGTRDFDARRWDPRIDGGPPPSLRGCTALPRGPRAAGPTDDQTWRAVIAPAARVATVGAVTTWSRST